MARLAYVFVILLFSIQVSYQQYTLNGKPTDTCPFYTSLNQQTQNCDSEYSSPDEQYNVLSEFWFKKNLAITELDPNWQLGNVDSGTVITSCGDLQIYGGHNALKSSNKKTRSLSASYSNLAPHKEIQINFKFYFIDTWDAEWMKINVDGVQIDAFQHDGSLSPSNLCGRGDKDFVREFHYDIAHSAETLSITIEWSLNENSDNESGGIREIQVVSTAKTLYYLNGKFTDRCPFYAPLDAATKTCVDPYFSSTQTQQFELLDESLFTKQFDFSAFKSSHWVSDNPSDESEYISICGPLSIYGGYNKIRSYNGKMKSISARFYNLDPHTEAHIRFQFWYIDSWDNERMQVRVNGVVQQQIQVKVGQSGSKAICGNGNFNEFVANYEVKVPHSIDYLEVVIEWILDEGSANESGGVRELQIVSLLNPRTYSLNGKKADRCPWYTKADETTLQCIDELANSYQVPIVLDELFYNKDFSVFNLEKGSRFIRTFTDKNGNYISGCGGLSLFGGYKVFQNTGVKYKGVYVKYQNLEPHDQITIRFNFYMLDTWDGKDNLEIYLDKVVYKRYWKDNSNPKQYLCGIGNENDFVRTFTFTFDHTNKDLEIDIQWNLDEGTENESGGIRDLQVLARGIPPIDLNGKNTDMCPFYTTFDAESRVCVDNYVKALGNPFIVSEALYKRHFSEQELFAQGWQPLALDTKNNYISSCGDIELYGGFGALSNTGKSQKSIKATFQNLKPHHQVSLKFRFFFLDSWDDEVLQVKIGGVAQAPIKSNYIQNPSSKSVCGNTGFSDRNIIQVYTFNHTDSSLSLEIEWNLNQDTLDESGGLRDIQVVAAGCVQPRCISCLSESECLEYLPEPVIIKEEINAPVDDSSVPEGDAPVDDSIVSEGEAPIDDSIVAEGEVPTDDSAVVEGEAPVDDSTAAEGDSPVDETLAEGEAPVDDSAVVEGEAPVDDSTIIEGDAPVDDSTAAEGEAPVEETLVEEDALADETLVEGEAPVDDSIVAEGEVPADDSTATEGDAPADDSIVAEGEVPADDSTATEGDAPVDDSTAAEGEVPADDSAVAEGEAPVDDSTPDETTADPSQFDLSYYQNNQEPFVDPLQSTTTENLPEITPETETIAVPADIGFDEEDLGTTNENTIDLEKLAEQQQQEAIATQECVILYSECYFQGEQQKFCDDSPYMIKTVKSIYIPSDVKRVKLFEEKDFQGKKSEFTESQECLEEINYQFLLNSHLKISKKSQKQKNFLRKNAL